MTSTSAIRHPARSQILPLSEAELLNSLSGYALYIRARELFNQGWTLRAIGEALTPPRPRSTVRYWVTHDTPITGAMPLPTPTAPTPMQNRTKSGPRIKRTLAASEATRLQLLAPIARKFRAAMPVTHPAAQANEELTTFVVALYEDHVPLRELADATGVTYRAMAKRIEKYRAR